MSRNTCEPAPGTAAGTRHILRRGDGGLLMDWHNNEWRVWFPEIPGFVTFQPAGLAQDGWHYAGPCPPLPELPTEPWEIAEAWLVGAAFDLDQTAPSPNITFGSAVAVLRQIAAMKPGDAPWKPGDAP